MLPLPPLRTVLATFTAHGSSLSNAPFGTRFHHFLCRLDNTRLQPTHILINFAPPDAMPVIYVGNRTGFCLICRHLLVFPSQFYEFSRQLRPSGSLPLSRRLIFQTVSASLQNGVRFLPFPIPATSSAPLTTCFPLARKITGFPRSA